MSLLELFKTHVSQHVDNVHAWWHRNQLAEFYAGFYGRAMDVHMFHELKDCMGYDDEALYMWGKAIEHLSRDERQLFKEASGRAKELSQPLFEGCKANGKFNIVEMETAQWFRDFWSQPDALDIMMENIEAHPFKVKLDIIGMRLGWALGLYYPAGRSYGHFWKHLMGHPTWNADLSSLTHDAQPEIKADKVDKEHANAIFNASSFSTVTGTDFADAIEKCVRPDAIEYDVLDAMIGSMKRDMTKEDKIASRKYFETTMVLDGYNWQSCADNKELMAAATEWSDEFGKFWGQPDREDVISKNVEGNEKQLVGIVKDLKSTWGEGDFKSAGVAYGQLWGILMGKKL